MNWTVNIVKVIGQNKIQVILSFHPQVWSFIIGWLLIDFLLNIESVKTHPKMKDKSWGWRERTAYILIWPIASLIFLIAFIKERFK